MKTLPLFVASIALALMAPQVKAGPQEQVDRAAAAFRHFKSMPEIPRHVLRDARGVAILTVAKGAFIFSGQIGKGVVVARTAGGWSGPAFIRTFGAGWGAQIGGEKNELVFVLNTRNAVKAFARRDNVQLGGDVSVAAGPVGREATAGVTRLAGIYAYSLSKGLFVGASVQGTVLTSDKRANERYYGRPVGSYAILRGRVSAPTGAAVLWRAL